MLLSAAMISFRRIMLNININTYTIDFSLPALKEREFQSGGKGDSIALNLIWWFHVSIDILKFRLVWSPVQYPCLTPASDFFHLRKRCVTLKKREKLWSLCLLSLIQILCNPYPQNHSESLKGQYWSISMERKGQVHGSSMKILLLPINSFGLNEAICENLQNIKVQWDSFKKEITCLFFCFTLQ